MKCILYFSVLSLLFFSEATKATLTECGEYSANGVVRAKSDGIKFIINEKTLSEFVISLPVLEQMKIAGFVDKDVTIVLLLNKKTIGQKLESSEIRSATLRIPDPLNPKDTGLSLRKGEKCAD